MHVINKIDSHGIDSREKFWKSIFVSQRVDDSPFLEEGCVEQGNAYPLVVVFTVTDTALRCGWKTTYD